MEKTGQEIKEALGTLKDVLPDIVEACVGGHYIIEANRRGDTKEIIRCIQLYTLLTGVVGISGQKLQVLAYYLKFGYNKDTKNLLAESMKISMSNLNVVNCALRKVGMLIPVEYSQSENTINEKLLEFKNYLVDNQGSHVLIKLL